MALSISGYASRYDAYSISAERGLRRAGPSGDAQPPAPRDPQASRETDPSKSKGPGGKPLSDSELRTVEELKKRDRAVRAHEQAHMAAGGAMIRGGATYQYQTGPDGLRYAVGGEVSIDTSTGKTPRETIARAQTIKAAALAPADPSGADRAAAANAGRMEAEAHQQLGLQGPEGSRSGAQEAEAGDARMRANPDRPATREGRDGGDIRIARGIAAYQAANEAVPRPMAPRAGLELMA